LLLKIVVVMINLIAIIKLIFRISFYSIQFIPFRVNFYI